MSEMMGRVVTYLFYLLSAAVGIACAAWGVVAVRHAEVLTAVICFGFAVTFVGAAAALVRALTGRVRVRLELDTNGTLVRPDLIIDRVLQVVAVGSFVSMALLAVCALLGEFDAPIPPGLRDYLWLASGFGALIALPVVWRVLARGGISTLRLTAGGLELGGALSAAALSWSEIEAVTNHPARGRKPLNTGTTFISSVDGRTRTLGSDWYTPGGETLREWVRFYWQHPEHRAELTDGRAIDRLESQL